MGGTWILAWPPQRWVVARPGRGSFDAEARPRNLQCPGHEFPPCQQRAQRSMAYQCWNFRRRGQRRRQSIPQYQVGPSPRCPGRQGLTPLAGAVQRGGWFTGSCSASKADEVVLTVLAGLGCQWQALAEPWTSPRGSSPGGGYCRVRLLIGAYRRLPRTRTHPLSTEAVLGETIRRAVEFIPTNCPSRTSRLRSGPDKRRIPPGPGDYLPGWLASGLDSRPFPLSVLHARQLASCSTARLRLDNMPRAI